MRSLILLLLWTALPACSDVADDDDSSGPSDDDDSAPITPPEGCGDLLQGARATELVAGLDAAAAVPDAVWPDHSAAEASVVLFGAGESGTCALLHRGGVVAWGLFDEDPTLLTPLFGYHLPWGDGPAWVQPLADAAEQPAAWADWLDAEGATAAALLPIDAPSISPLSHLQLAVHEAFHVQVQAPAWFGQPTHPWPVWDQQPARAQLAACYADPSLADERSALNDAVDAAWRGAEGEVCSAWQGFVAARSMRRAAASGVAIDAADGVSTIGCAEAEAILEAEEGTAEYAAWALLRESGEATDAAVIDSLAAAVTEPFYKLGAGQFLLLRALEGDALDGRLRAIAGSTSAAEGSIEAIAAAALQGVCD